MVTFKKGTALANRGMEVFAYSFMPYYELCDNYNPYGKGLRVRAGRSH